MIQPEQFASDLTERFGLPLKVSIKQVPEGQELTIQPEGIEHTIAFTITVLLGWRSVTGTFRTGAFATDLVKGIHKATADQKAVFVTFAQSLKDQKASPAIVLDGQSVPAANPESWTENWHEITISMKRVGLLVEKDDGYNYEEVFPLLTGFMGLCLALLPLEEEVTGEFEGERTVVQANRYERSRINRAACIQAHGSTCTVCGFDFGKFYGISGQGFIEVHHVKPVSQMGEAYRLNPETDLIPVCSNCHSMIHHQNPPLSIEQLREMIKSNGHR